MVLVIGLYTILMYLHVAGPSIPAKDLAEPLPQTPSGESQTSAAKANDAPAEAGGPKVKSEKECMV